MLADAQSSMRHNYINGGPGVFISGLVWLIAAIVTTFIGFNGGIIAFFIGGMLIHPVSALVENKMKQEAAVPDKGLIRLSLLTLPLLFGGLFLAYILSVQNQALFYPVMAIVIGLRYVAFQRIYGLNVFIILGTLLSFVGALFLLRQLETVFVVPIVVGVVELFFGTYLTRRKLT
ncbi:MAG: hypothetical protein L3J65_02005 [Robiginitomaculum sp.]|nr:hypothetical protein [Robiginitomaculum sp.]